MGGIVYNITCEYHTCQESRTKYYYELHNQETPTLYKAPLFPVHALV